MTIHLSANDPALTCCLNYIGELIEIYESGGSDAHGMRGDLQRLAAISCEREDSPTLR